jgi:SAM-dependent methyltransferase
MKSIIGGRNTEELEPLNMDVDVTHKTNEEFWDTVGSEFLGVTALPHYGAFVTEEKLHLLDDTKNKRVLEIGCGNGHSLEYISKQGVSELWGLDISQMQINRTKQYLLSQGIDAKLLCAPMENECGIPNNYFDIVYSVYAIGWTTDLDKTFSQIASYLKKDGVFIFSWSHPIHKCVSVENDKLVFSNSYFDESWYSDSLAGKKIMLSNRKISTYINSLSKCGFAIEQLIEETDQDMIKTVEKNEFANKAQMLPVTFVIKARKL